MFHCAAFLLGALALSCSGAEPVFDIVLPSELALDELPADSLERLRAVVSIPGVLDRAELEVRLSRGRVRGEFTIANVDIENAPVIIEYFSALDLVSEEVLIGRSIGSIDIVSGRENYVRLEVLTTAGEPVFDLNRNGKSNLEDLILYVDPAPGSSPIDVSPQTISFAGGIEVGDFTRAFFVVENTSKDNIDIDMDIRLAPGVTVVPLSSLFDNGAATSSTHLELTLLGNSERVFAITFAPANSLFLVGSLAVKLQNQFSNVQHSMLLRLLGNPQGAIPEPPPGYMIPVPAAGQTIGGYSGPVEPYPKNSLFSRAPNLSPAPEIDAGDVNGIDVDFAYLVSVLPRHRFAATLDGLAEDIDLHLFRLDDTFQPLGGPVASSETPGTSAESLEFDWTAERSESALLLVVLDNISGETVTGVPGSSVPGALTQAQTSTESSGTMQTAMFSVPEFLPPCPEGGETAETGPCGPITASSVCPPSYGSALACGASDAFTQFTLAGRNFLVGVTVDVGDSTNVVCSEVVQKTDRDEINCLAPPSDIDPTVNTNAVVSLRNPDGQRATLVDGFAYLPPAPVVFALTPNAGPVTGGMSVSVRGANFFLRDGLPPTVTFADDVASSISVINDGELQMITPVCTQANATLCTSAKTVDVVVTNPDGQLGTLFNGFGFTLPVGPAPEVLSVTPSQGSRNGGTRITVSGLNFDTDATTATPVVRIGGANGSGVVVIDAQTLEATTPPGTSGATTVEVVNPDLQTGRLLGGFTYLIPAPNIQFVFPVAGPQVGETEFLITGTDFQIGAQVLFDILPGTNLSVSTNSISGKTPPGPPGGVDVAVDVTVINPDGQQALKASAFIFEAPSGPPPSISGVSPSEGGATGGTLVTINGANFKGPAQVSFDQTSTSAVTVVDAQTITAILPPHPEGSVSVTVRNVDGQIGFLAGAFTYIVPPPSIAFLNPSQGPEPGNTLIQILGSDFQLGLVVTFDDIPATSVQVPNTSTVTCRTPPGSAGDVNVVLTNPDFQSTSVINGFTYVAVPPPSVALVSPSTGPERGGTFVQVLGSGFQAGAFVTFDGAPALDVAVANDSTITCRTPAHAPGAVDVTVTNTDGLSSIRTNGFTYEITPPPTVVQVLPNRGPTAGGSFVQIFGSDFQDGAAVVFGSAPALNIEVLSDSLITVLSPQGSAGSVPVTVTNPDAQNASLSFVYETVSAPPPVISFLDPQDGTEAGGTRVTIHGTDFDGQATAFFGTAQAQVLGTDSSSVALVVLAPPGVGGSAVTVRVQNPDGQSAFGSYSYTTQPAQLQIAVISPAAADAYSNPTVLIFGQGFEVGATVWVDSGGAMLQASNVLVLNGETMTATLPRYGGSVIQIDVPAAIVVTNPDGSTARLDNGYLYQAVTECIPGDFFGCNRDPATNGGCLPDGTTCTDNQDVCVCNGGGPQCVCALLCDGQSDTTPCGCGGSCSGGMCQDVNLSCPAGQICIDGGCSDLCGGCASSETCVPGPDPAQPGSCMTECNSDGTRQYPEDCDGQDLDGVTCIHLGYAGGGLRCATDCRFDATSCIPGPGCGDGTVSGDGSGGGTPCATGTFTCADGSCVPSFLVCDGAQDCPVGSDEASTLCGACGGGMFECDAGTCMGAGALCDGWADCGDGRDEDPSICAVGGGGGWEACDGPAPLFACSTYADFASGDVTCTSACQYDFTACQTNISIPPPGCGNGRIDFVGASGFLVEQCDGADLGAIYGCAVAGLGSGYVGCTPDCRLDFSNCQRSLCGNARIDNLDSESGPIDPRETGTYYEECDGPVSIVPGGCATFGFLGGTFGCSACRIDFSACTVAPAQCGDGAANFGESDVDCGGPCSGCATGAACSLNSDCFSGVCTSPSCVDPTCSDGVRNGGEAATDCGQGCQPCVSGSPCDYDGDCDVASGIICVAAVCTANICGDGIAGNGEQCDGFDLNGSSCEARGYVGGTLACTGGCIYDQVGCTGGSGNCTTNADCNSGVECIGGECVTGPCLGYQCADGSCIDPALVCDGTLDCPDGSDEDPVAGCAAMGCGTDSDCDTGPPWCDPATGSCVPCLINSHCNGGEICTATRTCVAGPSCTTDGDCGGALPRCETGSGSCVGCLAASD